MLGRKFPCVALHTKKTLQNVSDKKKNIDERQQKNGGNEGRFGTSQNCFWLR